MTGSSRLIAQSLSDSWYWSDPPPDWLLGFGDIFPRVGYAFRDSAGLPRVERVLAVCTEHPCDAASGLRQRASFARAYLLEEYLADNPRAWSQLPNVAAGRHFDLCLLPARPGQWETELLVDLADDFSAELGPDFTLESRLCGLRDGYWHTFAQYVARRASRAGVAHPIPSFKTVVVPPQEDGVPRPDSVDRALFDTPLLPGEVDFRPKSVLGLKVTHLLREQAQQDWWKAEWPEFTWLAGYALTSESAVEVLIRAIRRSASDPASLPAEARTQFANACAKIGVEGIY